MNLDDLSIDRRTAVTGLAVVTTAGALASCSRYSNSGSTSGKTATSGGSAVAKTTDIPVGGGKIIDSVVITQPTAGQFKAFSSTCPHQGCSVASVSNGKITCPCHGSQFNVTDGSVLNGPAATGLTAKQITVSGDSITLT